MTPIQTTKTSGLSRRKVLKTLTIGGLLVTAAGPLAITNVWSWLTANPPLAFKAEASGKVQIRKRGLGKGAGKGKMKIAMKARRHRGANQLGHTRKMNV